MAPQSIAYSALICTCEKSQLQAHRFGGAGEAERGGHCRHRHRLDQHQRRASFSARPLLLEAGPRHGVVPNVNTYSA